jgi:hypothetical protein
MTPGLRAAALLAADGTIVAGDTSLGGEMPANQPGPVTVRGNDLSLVARVDGPLLPGLLRADLATAVAAAEAGRGA